MINKAIIMGRVGNDPEIRNEGKIANFTIATTESWKDRDGKKQEKTEWHRIVIFNDKMIEHVVSKYVKKGVLIYIEGKLQTRKYNDANGVEKYTTEIVMNGYGDILKLVPTGQKQDSQNSNEASQEEEIPEDEVPF